MEERVLRLARGAVVAVLAAAFVAGIFLPVYTDEVGWRFQERAGIDGVDKLFNDICGPNTLAVPPLFMMPVRYFSAYMNIWFADPFYVRVSGILYALAWLAMLLALIRKLVADRQERAILGLWGTGLVALANMPLLMVMSRPEQPLLLSATAALLLAFADRRADGAGEQPGDTPARTAWLRSLAILFLASVAPSYHPKGIFLLPLFLACLYFVARGRASLLPRMSVAAMIAAMAVLAFGYWSARLDCPGDPILSYAYRNQNFGTHLSSIHDVPSFVQFVGKLIGTINLWAYGNLALPQEIPMSRWLPEHQVTPQQTIYWGIFAFFLWFAGAIFAAYYMLRALWTFVRTRQCDRRIFFSLLILALMIAWSATQKHRNVYEAIWVVPLLVLSAIFAMSTAGLQGRINAVRTVLGLFVGLAAIGSMAMIAETYGPSLLASSRERPFIAAQGNSVPVFGFARQKPAILAVARQCGITDPARAHALTIDDLTYFAFMKSSLPQHRLGVFSAWNGTIRDPVAYLKSRRSDGIVVICQNLPADLRRRAKGDGTFCCLGPPDW